MNWKGFIMGGLFAMAILFMVFAGIMAGTVYVLHEIVEDVKSHGQNMEVPGIAALLQGMDCEDIQEQTGPREGRQREDAF